MSTSQLRRGEVITLGRTTVTLRLESLGCTVTAPSSRTHGKLEVTTPVGPHPRGVREAEFGISLAHLLLAALERYRWDDAAAADYFR